MSGPPALESLLAELAAWAAAHGPAPERHDYGPGPDHEADLRLPPGHGPHPVAVLLHGGFWRARFTRSLLDALAADLAGRGWASWNIEYRRTGTGGGVPATLDDVRAAVAALRHLDAPLDHGRTVAVGHSAGGQLALATAGATGVAAVVSLAGVCDLAAAAHAGLGEDATVAFMDGTPEERPEAYAAADPVRRLPLGVPALLVHGEADERVPVDQSRAFAAAARAAGDACELLELPGAGHFALIDPRTPEWAAVAGRLEALAR